MPFINHPSDSAFLLIFKYLGEREQLSFKTY